MFNFIRLTAFILASLSLHPHAHPLHVDQYETETPSTLLQPTFITELSAGSWIENQVIRSTDSNIVGTLIQRPEVYLFSTTGQFSPILVATFPNASSCLGIVELGRDVFYTVVGNLSASGLSLVPGSFSIWQVDLRDFSTANQTVYTQQIIKMPEAEGLNGLTVLNPVKGTLLAADGTKGVVWSINVRTETYSVVIEDSTMAPSSGAIPSLGINGLHIHENFLYYTNTDKAGLNRIPIELLDGEAIGPAQVLYQNMTNGFVPDDFIIDFAGNIWTTSNSAGRIVLFKGAANPGTTYNGTYEVVAGTGKNDSLVVGPTALTVGSHQADLERGSLYITESVGRIVRIDTVELENY